MTLCGFGRVLAVLRAILLATVLTAVAGAGIADVPVPPLKAAVTDLTGTLSAPQVAALAASLKAFADKRGSQVAVLLVPTTQPEAIEQYAIRVAEAWKVGRKKQDDGVILVVAKNDRTLRIEVGYGLEGAIPDAIAKRIVAEIMTPRFKSGDFNGGLADGTAAIMKLIEGEKLPEPALTGGVSAQFRDISSNTLFMLFVALVAVSRFARAVLGRTVGALLGGGFVGFIAWIVFGSLVSGVLVGMLGFLLALFMGASSGGLGGGLGGGRGGWGGGSSSGGFGGGGFSGGGGGFGGGGASGRW